MPGSAGPAGHGFAVSINRRRRSWLSSVTDVPVGDTQSLSIGGGSVAGPVSDSTPPQRGSTGTPGSGARQ